MTIIINRILEIFSPADDFDLSKTDNLSDAERLGLGLGAIEPEGKTKGEDNNEEEAGEG